MKKKPVNSKKIKLTAAEEIEADAEGGEGGDGGNGSSGGGAGIIPSYFDIYASNVDEDEITRLSAKALKENRISVKSKGISVTALDKPQEARSRMQNDNVGPEQEGGGGLGLEDHPSLAESGGMVDPNIIAIPKSEQDALAVQDLDLKLELLAKYKKSMDMKMGMALKDQPRPGPTIRPTNASRPRPRPF